MQLLHDDPNEACYGPTSSDFMEKSLVSSLRVATLRLVWLEVFLDVADSENMSATARNLAIDQSTVSRHLQALQKWLGKKLICVTKIADPDDPGANVALTKEGQDFREIAKDVLKELSDFRDPEAISDELLSELEFMAEKVNADIESKKPSEAAQIAQAQISPFTEAIRQAKNVQNHLLISSIHKFVRVSFRRYENELRHEKKRNRAAERRKANAVPSGKLIVPPRPSSPAGEVETN